jgi:hypothetical protein
MPELDEHDMRSLVIMGWIFVCVVFLAIHLDMERAQSLAARHKVEAVLSANQKAIAQKLGVTLVSADGNAEN